LYSSFAIVVLMVSVPASAATSAPTPRHSKSQAELNLLHASRVLARWKVGLVDPRTNLLRGNTVAVCEGRGRPLEARYPRFVCALRTRTRIVSVSYWAQRSGGFEIRKVGVRPRLR